MAGLGAFLGPPAATTGRDCRSNTISCLDTTDALSTASNWLNGCDWREQGELALYPLTNGMTYIYAICQKGNKMGASNTVKDKAKGRKKEMTPRRLHN